VRNEHTFIVSSPLHKSVTSFPIRRSGVVQYFGGIQSHILERNQLNMLVGPPQRTQRSYKLIKIYIRKEHKHFGTSKGTIAGIE